MSDDRWWRGVDDRLSDLVKPGARLLDVGCGDGRLVERLREAGLEAFGVDPRAPERPHLRSAKVEDLAGEAEYDAIVAVMSLHHAELGAVCASIGRLLRADGVLLVSDFDWPAYDERAARWLVDHDTSCVDRSAGRWRAEHADLHTGEVLRGALRRSFEVESEDRGPYLARMLGRRDLEAEERRRIEDESLPALGLEVVCRLRSSRGA